MFKFEYVSMPSIFKFLFTILTVKWFKETHISMKNNSIKHLLMRKILHFYFTFGVMSDAYMRNTLNFTLITHKYLRFKSMEIEKCLSKKKCEKVKKSDYLAIYFVQIFWFLSSSFYHNIFDAYLPKALLIDHYQIWQSSVLCFLFYKMTISIRLNHKCTCFQCKK